MIRNDDNIASKQYGEHCRTAEEEGDQGMPGKDLEKEILDSGSQLQWQCGSHCCMFVPCSSRYRGELTAGIGSLRELLPSVKGLFYVLKLLKQQQLIKSQVTGTLSALDTGQLLFMLCFLCMPCQLC